MDAPKRTITRARGLRRELSPPEVKLWAVLPRRGPDGLRFRRQHPLGPYVIDFYCDAAKLAVEVDGANHDERAGRDARRDRWLAEQGVATLRIASLEVLQNLDGAMLTIVEAARERIMVRRRGG